MEDIIRIKELKDTSKLWINNSKKMFSDKKVYYISSDIVLNNLYYENKDGMFSILDNDRNQYKNIYEDLKKNGWDNRYPVTIGIGNRGEVFIDDGNHRVNLIKDINLDYIPFMFHYINDYNPTNKSVYLEDGRDFYPYGLLPKWTNKI